MTNGIKYSTIKDNIKRYYFTQTIIERNGDIWFYALLHALELPRPTHIESIVKEWTDKICSIIDHWDIRRVKTLIELFPGCVPSAYQNTNLIADMDAKGEWKVYYK